MAAANPQMRLADNWETRRIPEPRQRPEIEYTTTHRGLSVKATRSSYNSVMTQVHGYVGARSVSVFGHPSSLLTDDNVKGEALALAEALADMGMTGEPVKAGMVPS